LPLECRSLQGVETRPALVDLRNGFEEQRRHLAGHRQADAERRAARQSKLAADEAAAKQRAARIVTDSTGQKWSTVAPPRIDSVRAAATRDSTAKKDSTVKKDTTVKAKPDTLVRPDTGSYRRR